MGLRVFLDAWEIRLFKRLVDQLQDGIQNARSCLIFFSQYAEASPWVRQECSSLITRAITQREFGIVPVRLDGTDLPPFLRDWPWQDLVIATDTQIADFVRRVARGLNVPVSVVDSMESRKIWASQSELSVRLFFTLLSLGLDRKAFKPIWRIADILQRGPNFPPRVIEPCKCGGVVYCGYADMGAGPQYYDSYFHICDTCFAHEYTYERSSSMTDELPRCPWCDYEWHPKPFTKTDGNRHVKGTHVGTELGPT
jgi:hypothetical protein